MRRFWIMAGVLLFGLLAAFRVFAEDNRLTATAPTENTDGSALTDLASIKVYHSLNAQGGPYSLLDQVTFTAAGGNFTYVHADQLDGLHCYVVTAVRTGGQESIFSNEACKDVDTILPRALIDLAVD